MSEEKKCTHDRYTTNTSMVVVKLAEIESWQLILKISVVCTHCKSPFTFRSHHGFSTSEPTVNNGSTEIRIPIDYPSKEEGEDLLPPPRSMIH